VGWRRAGEGGVRGALLGGVGFVRPHPPLEGWGWLGCVRGLPPWWGAGGDLGWTESDDQPGGGGVGRGSGGGGEQGGGGPGGEGEEGGTSVGRRCSTSRTTKKKNEKKKNNGELRGA